jgi:hypothetical protein
VANRYCLIFAYNIGIVAAVRDWAEESRIDGLVLSIPEAGDQATTLVIRMENLTYLYLSEIDYTVVLSHSMITNLYISCSSEAVNLFAEWLLHLKDLRIKELWVDEPFDASLQMKNLIHLYIGRISEDSEGMAGDYLIKLVFASAKVRFIL